MKSLIVFSLFATATCALIACDASERMLPSSLAELDDNLLGKWQLHSITRDGKLTKPSEKNATTFELKQKSFSGNGPCNHYSGKFQIDESGKFQIQEQQWTEMACDDAAIMELESLYVSALGNATQLTFKEGQLILSDGTDKNKVVFIRFEEPAARDFQKTEWTLTAFEETSGEGDMASVSATPVLDSTSVTLTIDEGQFSGSGGCNRYGGKVEITDNKLKFGPAFSTRKLCGEEVMNQERRFLETLSKMTSYKIKGDRLTLLDENGKLSLQFSAKK